MPSFPTTTAAHCRATGRILARYLHLKSWFHRPIRLPAVGGAETRSSHDCDPESQAAEGKVVEANRPSG